MQVKRGCILVAIASILSIALPSLTHAFDCTAGRYVGKSWSASAALHGKEVTVVVTPQKERCELRFRCPATGADEIWELTGNKLVQRELDAAGKEKLRYGATLEVRGGNEGYFLDCAADGKCDANVDPRSFWRIENKGRAIVYSFWGVDPEKAGDLKAVARKRIEYTLTPSP